MTGSQSPPADLLFDTGLDAWVDELTAPGPPADLVIILQNPQEANLDIDTINLLSNLGVYDAWSFIQLTQESFSDLLGSFSNMLFGRLSSDSLCNAQLYGCYLMEQKLVHADGTIDSVIFDWHAYYTFWYHHRCQVGFSFNAPYHLKAEAHHHEDLVTQMRRATLTPPIGPPLVVTTPVTHVCR